MPVPRVASQDVFKKRWVDGCIGSRSSGSKRAGGAKEDTKTKVGTDWGETVVRGSFGKRGETLRSETACKAKSDYSLFKNPRSK